MRFDEAIDAYIDDMKASRRLTSASSERGYRSTLEAHGEDVGNRDPAYVGREDLKRTLRRWANANTQGTNRSDGFAVSQECGSRAVQCPWALNERSPRGITAEAGEPYLGHTPQG